MLSQKTLKQLVNKLNSGIIVSDPNGNFLLWNEKAESIIGMDIKNPKLVDWTEYFSIFKKNGEQLQLNEIPIIKALEGKTTLNEVILVKNKKIPNGVYINIDSFPLEVENGQNVGVIVFYNITDKVKMEELFDEIARRFEHLKTMLQFNIGVADNESL